MEPVQRCTPADKDDSVLRRLLWEEYPHVKRCVKRVLEDNAGRREQAYPAALQRALELYRSERTHRAAMGEDLAQNLDTLGKPAGPYPCPVSATLFTANYDIQSLLVSQDPLVKHCEEFIRQTLQTMAQANRFNCRFDALLAAYLDFAAQHRDRIVALSPSALSPASPSPSLSPLPALATSRRKLPLGLQPYLARLAGNPVAFPTAAAWAAFVANKTLWQRLAGSPTAPATATAPTSSAPHAMGLAGEGRFRRPPPASDDKWANLRSGAQKATSGAGPRAVFLLAPDVDEWERR